MDVSDAGGDHRKERNPSYLDGLNNNQNEQTESDAAQFSYNIQHKAFTGDQDNVVVPKELQIPELKSDSNCHHHHQQNQLDSGHFTVTPETDNSGGSGYSGSPRSHSPLCEMVHPPMSMSLVLKASREHGGDGTLRGYAGTEEPHFPSDDATSVCSTLQSEPFSTVSVASSRTIMRHHIPLNGGGDDGTSVEYLKSQLDTFNSLYEEKLKLIDDFGAHGDAKSKEILVN
jgi:hypothetical protein